MKKTCSLLVLLVLGNSLISQNYSPEVEAKIKQVENNLVGFFKIDGQTFNLLERMAFYKVKGLSIAVIHDYKIVWAKGYGWADEKEKRPVTTETLFEPGSISKALNAVGILKLVQDKKLDLNTDINTYLKSWKFPYDSVSHNKKITLYNLLSHTAGLTVSGFHGYDRKAKLPTIQQILDGEKPANTPPVRSAFEPGLRYEYSGGGIVISQLIITDVTHQPYDKFMYDNVLKPIGMVNSFFSQPPPDDKLKYCATGYLMDGNEVENKFNVYPTQAPAGLWMTPSDLCNYIIEMQLAYQGKSSKVLNQEMAKLHLTPYIDKSATLGAFIEDRNGTKYFQHGAANDGFSGKFYGSMESGNGIAIFSNSNNSIFGNEVINSVATVYKWKDFYNPINKKVVTVPDSIMQKYVGLYSIAKNHYITIMKKEDGYYQCADGNYSKMYFTSPTDYFNADAPSEKSFKKDAAGNITGFVRKFNGSELFAQKYLNPDSLTGTPWFYGSLGGHYLENKNFDWAIRFFKRRLELDPEAMNTRCNLAHAYLFNNEYDKAIKLYKENLDKDISPNMPFKKVVADDFVFFKQNGFDKTVMDKALADLKLEVPKGYKD